MDKNFVLEQIDRYQKATSQQERDDILYQIAVSSKLFTVRDLEQIAQQGGRLSEDQTQRVLGYVEAYFGLDLGGI